MSETLKAIPEVRDRERPRHCLILPGMMTNTAGLHAEYGMIEGFAKVYNGRENITAFNSSVSIDEPNPRRYQDMANVIKDHAASGIDIVAHSLGAEELRRAIRIIKKEEPEFFQREAVKENMRIVLDSPAGFNKGIKQRIHYGRGMTQLDGPLGVSIDALDAFPMQGISADDLDKILGPQSNTQEGISRSSADTAVSNDVYLSEEQESALSGHEAQIAAVVESEPEEALRLFLERGDSVKDPLKQSFEGTPDKIDDKGKLKISALGVRTAIRAFGSKAFKDFVKLREEGISVEVKMPQFDLLIPIEILVKFYGDEDAAKEHVEMIEKSGHRGIGLQPERYARAIKKDTES